MPLTDFWPKNRSPFQTVFILIIILCLATNTFNLILMSVRYRNLYYETFLPNSRGTIHNNSFFILFVEKLNFYSKDSVKITFLRFLKHSILLYFNNSIYINECNELQIYAIFAYNIAIYYFSV